MGQPGGSAPRLATHSEEKMAVELIQMGATELIQLGDLRYLGQATVPSASPVIGLFRLVDYLENPLSDVELEPGETVTAKERSIAERLHTLSRLARKGLVREVSLGDYSFSGLMGEEMRLAAILDSVALEAVELGKRKKRGIKGVARKVTKVVKSPAFLGVVGLAANLIPGAGQAISAVTLAAAAARAKQVQAKAAAEGKKVNPLDVVIGDVAPALAMSQAAGFFQQQRINAINADPSLTASQKAAAIAKIGDPGGAQSFFDSMPKPIQDAAEKLVPGLTGQIQTVGADNFFATGLKALGQSSAISDLIKGSGAKIPGMDKFGDVVAGFDDDKAKDAGEQDLKNLGAAEGASGTVDETLKRGKAEFPVIPVAIAGGTVVTLVVIALAGGFA